MLKTAKEVEAEFTADVQALLHKWGKNTVIDVETELGDYIGFYGRETIMVTVEAEYDADNNCTRDFTMFELGRHLSVDK